MHVSYVLSHIFHSSFRYIAKLNGKKKKKRRSSASVSSETEKGGEETEGKDKAIEKEDDEVPLSLDEYFKNAREKLEELQRKMEDDMFDDFDDLDICGSSEDEFCEVDDEDEADSDSDCERTHNG